MTAATLSAALIADGWAHVDDGGRDTWHATATNGDALTAQWRNPDFVVRLTAKADPEVYRLRWEATLFHVPEDLVLAAARAAVAHDDNPDIISRLPDGWHLCPVRELGADPLASFAYEAHGRGYLEYRVLEHDGPEQVRPVLYAVRQDGACLYTEPDCPAGVVAAVAFG